MKKEKQITSNNQLTPLETALQQQFKPDASRMDIVIREAYDRTAKIQGANIASMVGFGLLALSIKPIVGHGKFADWLKTALGGQIGKSTAYKWIEAAKFIISKIETAERQTDIIAQRICEFVSVTGIKGGAAEIFADAKLSAEFIAAVVGNLPFSTFLNILKTANANAIELEAAETKKQTALTKSDLRGLNGGETPKNPQMLLWDDWTNELENFDKLLEAPEKDLLDPEHWFQVENKLVVWLESVRKITKGLRK